MVKNILKVLGGLVDIGVKAAFLVLAVYVIVTGGQRAFAMGYDFLADDGKGVNGIVDIDITIPKGATAESIANILEEEGLIGNALYFRVMAKVDGKDAGFQYGNYHFNTGMSDEEIMEILSTEGEKRETMTFTIPEGYTVEQIAAKLQKEKICSKNEFYEALNNEKFGYEVLKDVDTAAERSYKLQGYLFPNTYEIYTDATAKDVVSKMVNQLDVVFKDEYYARAEELGLTIDEVITVASIIEREVRVDSERELVARVIYNRLKIDMNLEMCSTIMFALGEETRDRVLFEDLDIVSPYNTYRNPGLPLGPICNPGARSIEAALYPDDNDYLFFVLIDPETGEHEFNEKYEDHINAMKAHRQEF